MRLQNTYRELDFENRVAINTISETEITITSLTKMNTKYGMKTVAIMNDNRWFYLTPSLENLTKLRLPVTGWINKKTSKAGNEYWNFQISYDNDNIVTISSLEGTIIKITDMKLVTTKYGERNLITLSTGNKCFTSWTYLYNDFKDNLEALETDPLVVKVIKKKTKSGTSYISYRDLTDEEYDELSDLIADGDLPF